MKADFYPQLRSASCYAAILLLAGALQVSRAAHANESLDCLIEPHVLVELSSSEIGVLGDVKVDEADVVAAGDVLAILHNDVERASLALSRARADAKAEVELLRHDHEFNSRKRQRIDQLQDQQAISTQSADEVRTAEELARLRLRAATEKQRTARLEASRDALSLNRRTVRSPITGVVAKRYKSAGEYVDGDPILQLAQLDPLRVQVVAPISMYGKIKVGMQASVHPELSIDGNFDALVTSVDPVMDAATATFGVRLSLPNPDHRLPPGLRCTLVLRDAPASEKRDPALAQDNAPAVTQTPVALTSSGMPPRQGVPTAAAPDTPIEAPSQCVTVGPISTTENADALAKKLAASDVNAERRHLPGVRNGPRWVVLSSETENSPAQLRARIDQADIRDYQQLLRGDWKNRVSFGAYKGKNSAERRLNHISKLGFDVELVERSGVGSSIWLDLPRAADDPVVTRLVADAREDRPGLTVRSIPCAQLASR